MQRRIFLAGLATICLVGTSGAAPAPMPSGELFIGKVAGAGSKAITVVAKNGDNLEFMIAPDCRITLDGQPASADKLAVGLTVKIMASKVGAAHVANFIDAASTE